MFHFNFVEKRKTTEGKHFVILDVIVSIYNKYEVRYKKNIYEQQHLKSVGGENIFPRVETHVANFFAEVTRVDFANSQTHQRN